MKQNLEQLTEKERIRNDLRRFSVMFNLTDNDYAKFVYNMSSMLLINEANLPIQEKIKLHNDYLYYLKDTFGGFKWKINKIN